MWLLPKSWKRSRSPGNGHALLQGRAGTSETLIPKALEPKPLYTKHTRTFSAQEFFSKVPRACFKGLTAS